MKKLDPDACRKCGAQTLAGSDAPALFDTPEGTQCLACGKKA